MGLYHRRRNHDEDYDDDDDDDDGNLARGARNSFDSTITAYKLSLIIRVYVSGYANTVCPWHDTLACLYVRTITFIEREQQQKI